MPKITNLIGNRYGLLKVIAKSEQKDTGGKTRYVCECKCGNKNYEVRGTNLVPKKGEEHGRVISCGCAKSIGEYNITQTLLATNQTFAREYTFPDLKATKNLRFDFAVMTADNELSHLIEFDGIQHTTATGEGWNTEENLQKTKIRDNMKNEYTQRHNIPLIRIPYTQRDNITPELLNPQTSPYLV